MPLCRTFEAVDELEETLSSVQEVAESNLAMQRHIFSIEVKAHLKQDLIYHKVR